MKLLALGLALSLAACASPRGPEVAYHGALKQGSDTYSFAGGERQPERTEIEAAVSYITDGRAVKAAESVAGPLL